MKVGDREEFEFEKPANFPQRGPVPYTPPFAVPFNPTGMPVTVPLPPPAPGIADVVTTQSMPAGGVDVAPPVPMQATGGQEQGSQLGALLTLGALGFLLYSLLSSEDKS